jgi:tryptophan-rich sensory protein
VRFTKHPASIFSVIATITFVVTLIPDFSYIPTVPGASNPQTAILVLMHVIAAGVIVCQLTKHSTSPGALTPWVFRAANHHLHGGDRGTRANASRGGAKR